jgi:hypothetical protein
MYIVVSYVVLLWKLEGLNWDPENDGEWTNAEALSGLLI